MSRLVIGLVAGLLRLYPRRFRAHFAEDILRSVRGELRESRARGRWPFMIAAGREILSALSGVVPQHRVERQAAVNVRTMETVLRFADATRGDIATASRSLRSTPAFTAVAVLLLALGIGTTTAIFSVVDTVALRGLPFDAEEKLVAVGQRQASTTTPARNADPLALLSVAPQNYLDWAAEQTVFDSMAAFQFGPYALLDADMPPEDLTALRVTSRFFDVLRIRPSLGRTFTPEHEVDGDHRVAILSDALWRRRFGGDPAIIGRRIRLDDAAYEVIGVLPREFQFPVGIAQPTELWTPLVFPPHHRIRDPTIRARYLQVIARLKPDVSFAQAAAHIDRIGLSLQQRHPDWNKDTLAAIRPLRDHIVGARTRSWMLMLLGAVGLVLGITCANVASLLLARAAVRERDVAVRATLGAGRGRLVRQLLVENVLLASIGTAAAIVLASWVVGLLRTSLPPGLPRAALVAIDVRVLAVAAGLSVITALAFGILPALRLSRPDLARVLNDGSRGSSVGAGSRRVRSALVTAELTLSVVLLVGAALFIGSFRMLMKVDPGFDAENVLTASIQPRITGGITNSAPGGSVSVTGAAASGPAPDLGPAYQRIVESIAAIPGVRHAAAIAGSTPLGGGRVATTLTVPDAPGRKDTVTLHLITPDYHRALGMTLIAGRHIEAGDVRGAAPVVVITEAAASKYFPGGQAVGRTLQVNGVDRRIVGVQRDVQQNSLETDPVPEVYAPLAQSPVIYAELAVKTESDPHLLVPAIKTAVMQVMPDVPLRAIRTMEAVVDGRIALRRLNMLLIGLFGLLALAISAAGIYGLMTYLVSQRTREIGVRMALGATRGSVVGLVVRSAARLVAIGVALGCVSAWLFAATVRSFVFRIDVTDVRAFGTAVAALGLAAVVATILPARRAATVDPLTSLRSP